MANMNIKLQEIVMPVNSEYHDAGELFFRGGFHHLQQEDHLLFGESQKIDFATYFNSFSYEKWKKYTGLTRVGLHLRISGCFDLVYTGYDLVDHRESKTEYARESYNSETGIDINYSFPENAQMLMGFEIHTKSNCVFEEGYYSGEYNEQEIRNIDLSMVITTCYKEKFVTKNIELINRDILNCEGISDSFTLHIIDNGRTLDPDGINTDRITAHPNKNVGGAGGFARGMLESLKQKPRPSHVLLMDDDVLIMPEAIKRTIRLLKVLKPEFHGNFLAGAMLKLEKKNILVEDLNSVQENGILKPYHSNMDMAEFKNVLMCEYELKEKPRTYAAWWFCCMPIEAIEKNGLPLPLFIRSDDIEYGLRCAPGFIKMNGICVWHMGFEKKYTPSVDIFQVFRNMLILQASTGVFEGIDFFGQIRKRLSKELVQFNYDSAELLLMAFEDYLKGPELLLSAKAAEQRFMDNRRYNDKFLPINQFDLDGDMIQGLFEFKELKRSTSFLMKLTRNGHWFIPYGALKKEPGVILHDRLPNPESIIFRKQIIRVDHNEMRAVVREIDKKRYRKLVLRYLKNFLYYSFFKNRVASAYSAKMEYFTGMAFWEEYLFADERES